MDITRIPTVMRNHLRWNTAAQILERWFMLPANDRPAAGRADRSTIRMEWALRFSRCQRAYAELVRLHSWCDRASQDRIVSWLRSQGRLTAGASFGLRNFQSATPKQLDDGCICRRELGDPWTDPLDDLMGALGRFDLRVIILQGTVSPLATATRSARPAPPAMARPVYPRPQPGTRYEIRIDQVGIYIWDSFDFNGEQNLGFWNNTGVTRDATAPGYEAVTNSHFRQWRAQHGRGGDFYIYSDARIVSCTPPDTFFV